MKQQQIQQLKAALRDCIHDHSDLHNMVLHGPRDEPLWYIDPTPQELAPIELLMSLIESQLIILGHSPAELPSIEEYKYDAPF